jgi:hypothetical protein
VLRHVRVLVWVALALLCSHGPSFGYGAIAISKSGEDIPFWIVAFDAKNAADAHEAALRDCARYGNPCEILKFFAYDCVAFYRRQSNDIESVSAPTSQEARARAALQCSGDSSCLINHAPLCDPPGSLAPPKLVPTHSIALPPKAVSVAYNMPFSTRDRVLAFIQVYALEIVVVSVIVTMAALIFAVTAIYARLPPR